MPKSAGQAGTALRRTDSCGGRPFMSMQDEQSGTDRRQFLGRTVATGAGALVGASALEALVPSFASAWGVPTKGDRDILIAAEIAEALAVTTYTNIIRRAPFFQRLAPDDQ